METAKSEKTLNFKFNQADETFEIKMRKKMNEKSEELYISLENDENEFWDFTCSQQYLLELDPILKKFPDLLDIMDIIMENGESETLLIERKGETAYFIFKVKFIKAESIIKFNFQKRTRDGENPLAVELRNLRKEIELLKQNKKIPVINYIGVLNNNEIVSGELTLKTTMNVIFHLFIGMKTTYGNNAEESLALQIKNEKSKEEEKEKVIYKTWIGTYQSGSGYHDSKNVNIMFGEKLFQGKNTIKLKKNGIGSQIYTLYLIAEF